MVFRLSSPLPTQWRAAVTTVGSENPSTFFTVRSTHGFSSSTSRLFSDISRTWEPKEGVSHSDRLHEPAPGHEPRNFTNNMQRSYGAAINNIKVIFAAPGRTQIVSSNRGPRRPSLLFILPANFVSMPQSTSPEPSEACGIRSTQTFGFCLIRSQAANVPKVKYELLSLKLIHSTCLGFFLRNFLSSCAVHTTLLI